ncbi:hypothetical protein ACP70R_036948 [Stipagrostis hirtigluma subsp. patula]
MARRGRKRRSAAARRAAAIRRAENAYGSRVMETVCKMSDLTKCDPRRHVIFIPDEEDRENWPVTAEELYWRAKAMGFRISVEPDQWLPPGLQPPPQPPSSIQHLRRGGRKKPSAARRRKRQRRNKMRAAMREAAASAGAAHLESEDDAYAGMKFKVVVRTKSDLGSLNHSLHLISIDCRNPAAARQIYFAAKRKSFQFCPKTEKRLAPLLGKGWKKRVVK